ncbi:MAG: SIS domain-containing protein, partial [Actinobacteria bacterium]|nr:SIS domain-containing protein [Actinomycetota bacterium]
MSAEFKDYAERLSAALRLPAVSEVAKLARVFKDAWDTGKTIYLCGNGGSAGNAIHLANDFT